MGTILLLFALGLVLLLAELFLPGMVAGVTGGVLLGAGLVLTFLQFGVVPGLLVSCALAVVAMALFVVWLRIFPRTFFGRKLMLNHEAPAAGGSPDQSGLLGATGVALTPLRPAGTARILGRRVDVVAESSMIDAGIAVIVRRVEGVRVVVAPEVTEAAETPPA
jgi:membrane-bound serine protease (ClpP class)